MGASNLKKSTRSRSTSRLNKFLRTLFKLDNHSNNSQQQQPANRGGDTFVDADLDEESSHHNFTFSRLFNSFRGSHTSVNTNSGRLSKNKLPNKSSKSNRNSSSTNSTTLTNDSGKTLRTNSSREAHDSSTLSSSDTSTGKKELIVMDEQPSKLNTLTTTEQQPFINEQVTNYSSGVSYGKTSSKTSTGYSSSASSPVSASFNPTAHNNIDAMRSKFYSQVAVRLKKLVGDCLHLKEACIGAELTELVLKSKPVGSENATEQVGSFDVDDVPYIDDDLDSNYDLNEQHSPINSTSIESKPPRSTRLIDEKLVAQLVDNVSHATLDQIVKTNCFNLSEWHKIAAVFELVWLAVTQMDSNNQADRGPLIYKLKETAANYIHDKYCDWIFENGGWVIPYFFVCSMFQLSKLYR